MADAPADEVGMPALLRSAWGAYAGAVIGRLVLAGIDDLPRHGSFVLGGMVNRGLCATEMVEVLGISKQRASQLIDALVLRGYLVRQPNPEDRRRSTIQLTPRGSAAAVEIRAAVAGLDGRLAEVLAPSELAALRKGLGVLAAMRHEAVAP